MLLKIFGALLIFISCLVCGYSVKALYSMRTKELENFLSCMDVFLNEICYSMNSISDAINNMLNYSSAYNKRFFEDFLNMYKNSDGTKIGDVWHQAVNNAEKYNTIYSKNDIEAIKRLGNLLGRGDVNHQSDNINTLKNEISRNIADSKAINEKMSISTKLGIYIGIIIVIILF